MSGDAPPTLVKVGSGEWTPLPKGLSVLDENRGDLLEVLAETKRLAPMFAGVAQPLCKVFVLPTLDTEPAEAYQLALFATVKDLAGASPAKLFIRVELPAPPAGESGAGAGAGAGGARAADFRIRRANSLTFAPFPRALSLAAFVRACSGGWGWRWQRSSASRHSCSAFSLTAHSKRSSCTTQAHVEGQQDNGACCDETVWRHNGAVSFSAHSDGRVREV
jgi:hypothetical protein